MRDVFREHGLKARKQKKVRDRFHRVLGSESLLDFAADHTQGDDRFTLLRLTIQIGGNSSAPEYRQPFHCRCAPPQTCAIDSAAILPGPTHHSPFQDRTIQSP